MTLREVTCTVIGLVENVSGCSVVVSEDASLKTLAASRDDVLTNVHAILLQRSTGRVDKGIGGVEKPDASRVEVENCLHNLHKQ